MQTLKNLSDYHVWPVKHRHWIFEVAEDEAHGIWVRTRDLRTFWEKFPPDRELKATHSSALIYASDSKTYYITQRAMRQILQRSKSHSFYAEVLKFLDWFDRNVGRVAENKRTGERLEGINTHREQHEKALLQGPLRPAQVTPRMEESTLALSQEERWALAREENAVPKVFHPEARVLRTGWREWLAQGLPAVQNWLVAMWRGEANVWLTFGLAALLAVVPSSVLKALVPDHPEDWSGAIVRLLWGHVLMAVLSVVIALGILVVTTRCTRRSMGQLGTRWVALAMYCVVLTFLPQLAVGNFDRSLLWSWWDLVLGIERPVDVQADAQLGRIVLRGPIGFGSSEALRRVLERNPRLTLLELESPGGYAIEGFRMARLISQHGLDTVAFGKCSSACTLLFAAGKVRYLGPAAAMGFHRSGRKYSPVGDGWNSTDHAMAGYYAERGVQQEFIQKALTPSIAELWVAPQGEQFAAGYASLRWSERKAGY